MVGAVGGWEGVAEGWRATPLVGGVLLVDRWEVEGEREDEDRRELWERWDGRGGYRAWKRDRFVPMAAGVANRERAGWWARTAVEG